MTLAVQNKQRWDNMHIPANKGPIFKSVADRLVASKARYQAVEKTTGVPWWFIAVVHEREASQKWDTFLGNGQALSKKTTIVPKGRGPFKTWEEGAIDALVNCPPYASKNKDWSIGGALAMLEQYNGLGYYHKGVPSPYIWAGTDQYTAGKYIADGVYSATTVDSQLGCAGLLKFMGVFTSAAGAGTATGAIVAGGAAATAATSTHWWNYFTDHWVAIVLTVIGIGLLVDLGIAIYKNEKNNNG